MLYRIARAACLVLALLSGAAAAKADDLADFNAAVEAAAAHNRVAIGYLRTGNVDLASLEIDRMRAAWSKLVERFSGHRPAAFDGNVLYAKTLVGISARLVGADLLLKSGRLDGARQSLEAVRGDLYALRKSAHVAVLADCIRDSNKAAAAFMAYDKPDLDWYKPGTGPAVAEKAATYAKILTRCDAMASEAIRKSPAFRRLIDEAQTELAKVPDAVANRDTAKLHRINGSLRAIDNLLAFRFG
jgi:hypothetical protein